MTPDDKAKGYDIPLGPEFFDSVLENGEEKLVLNAAKLISRANDLWGHEGWSSETKIEQPKYPPMKKGVNAVLATSTCTIKGSGGNTHTCTATSLVQGADLHHIIQEATKKAKDAALIEAMSRFGEGLGLCGQDSEYLEQINALEVPKRMKFDPDLVAHHMHYDPTNTHKRPAPLIPATPEPVSKKTHTQKGDSDQGIGGHGNTAHRGTTRGRNTARGGNTTRGGKPARGGNKGGKQSSTSSASESTSTPSSTSPSESTNTPSSTSPSESTNTPSSSSSSEPTIASSSSSSSAFTKPTYTQTRLPY